MSTPPPRFVQELDLHVRARYPLLWLVSSEEQRVDSVLEALALEHGKELWTWSVTTGLRQTHGHGPEVPESRGPLPALEAMDKITQPALIVLKDFHPYLQDPMVVRRLRELAFRLKGTYQTCCLLSPVLSLPPELEKEITVIDIPLPTRLELLELFKGVVAVLRQSGNVAIDLGREQAARMIEAARGLTLAEAENAFAKAAVTGDKLSGDDVGLILEEKKQIIRKSGMLEYHEAGGEGLSAVGGNELLKAWLMKRREAFSEGARRFGLPVPRGLLLLGVQGCGKSLTARSVAGAWGLPLLRLDMGRIFAGLVGSSEENMRKAIRVAETVAPVVLWIDEIEKGLAGAGAGDLDAGVSSRVFGTFLTWLQEKSAPVFVVATANRIDALPPELMRKGRFDDIFFVDLPAPAQREEIFAIHLRQRGRDPAQIDLARLAAMSAGFSGSEIEQAVIAALYDAFDSKAELDQAHLERALAESRPLSQTMREDIEKLRAWARERTRPAAGEGLEVAA